MQLSINDLSMRFGARILFEDVRTTFISGRRYAITGPNGAGKSTLMKILTGEIEPEKGSVTRPKKMGVLRQDQFAFDAYRVLDTVIMGNSTLWDALQERETLYAKDSDTLTDRDGIRLGELEGGHAAVNLCGRVRSVKGNFAFGALEDALTCELREIL